LVVCAVLLGGLWPFLVQQFQVRPNEPDREKLYIERNIAATREAYGVSDVDAEEYRATTEVEEGQLEGDSETIPGIRLLDPNVVPLAFQQLQQVRGFYAFSDPLDVDRYEVDGENRDVVVAVRDVDLTGIPEGQQNWNNEHTVYTHGFGFVAAYGNTRAANGSPSWAEEDIPPTGELGTYDNVRRASLLAMAAGADFIKTSTGKVSPAATLPVSLCMLEAIRDVHEETGRKVGFKPAGGIRNAKQAVQHLVVVHETVGPDWLTPDLHRFGASSLLNDVLMQIRKEKTGRYQSPDYFTVD